MTKSELSRLRAHRWRQRHPERAKQVHDDYVRNHPEQVRAAQAKYRATNSKKRAAYCKSWRHKNREAYYARRAELRRIVRKAILEKLGNKCVRCEFDDPRALQIDHIHGGGCYEAKTQGDWTVYYARVLEWPEEKLFSKYQLLCANCNRIKVYENDEVALAKARAKARAEQEQAQTIEVDASEEEAAS